MSPALNQYGREYFVIFVGHSADGKEAADIVVSLKSELQRELDRLRQVNRDIPFNRVEVWTWENLAPAIKGGQLAVVAPALNRADAAVFVFKEKIGEVTWEELTTVRKKNPPIPVLAFFPAQPPAGKRMMDEAGSSDWAGLLKKQRELSEHWRNPECEPLTPQPHYEDLNDLKRLAVERLTDELVRIASAYANHQHLPSGTLPEKTNFTAPDPGQSCKNTVERADGSSSVHVQSPNPTTTARPVVQASNGWGGKTVIIALVVFITIAVAGMAIKWGINNNPVAVDVKDQPPKNSKKSPPPVPELPDVVDLKVGPFSLSLPKKFRRGDPINAFPVEGRPDAPGWIVAFSRAEGLPLWYVQDYKEIGSEMTLRFTWVAAVSEAEVLLCQVTTNELPTAIRDKKSGFNRAELEKLLPQSTWSAPQQVSIVK